MSSEARTATQTLQFSGRVLRMSGVVAAFAGLTLLPVATTAHEIVGPAQGHTLEVVLSFPDSGLAEGEQLCLGVYPDDASNFSAPPLQARCLDPGENAATFEGIAHGEFVVAVPGVGSEIGRDRYRGQLVETAIPDEPTLAAYGIDVELALAPGAAGTTGLVQVNVYGCPPGTEGGGDAEFWANECQALAGGIPLSLSGIGTIEHTDIEAVTGQNGLTSGRALFTDLPAGAYRLGGELPENVDSPAVFIQSSIEGGIKPVERDGTLDVRPTEVAVVDVYLVLDGQDTAKVESVDEGRTATILGFGAQQVTGGTGETEAAATSSATPES